VLLASSVLVGGAAAVSVAATQFVASRLGYHPALGAPWIGHFYAPWSWIIWQRAPWAANAASTFGLVKAGLAGLVALGALGVMSFAGSARRRPQRHAGVHGTARFQTEAEIRANGLLPASPGAPHEGVYIGGWTDKRGRTHYLRHDGPEHGIVIAPTRSGKGVGAILPTLLSWPASALIYDEKGELWQLTSGWRAKHANNVVIRWEPGAASGSACFNFLEEIRLGTPHEVSDAQAVAQAVCDPKGEGLEGKDHWTKTSWSLITGAMLFVCYRAAANGRTGTLADIAALLSDPARGADELWAEMMAHPHPVIAAAGRDMLDRPERERGSVLSSAKVYLTLFADPLVAANSRRSDFRLADLMDHEKPVSLYIVTRGTDKPSFLLSARASL
jgi:type IV secretion system protein VirD4